MLKKGFQDVAILPFQGMFVPHFLGVVIVMPHILILWMEVSTSMLL